VAGKIHGFRRTWGAAMNNWETSATEKHFVDPSDGGKPRIRIAFLDIEEEAGATVNGLAVPVDAPRLAEFDAREVNYLRFDLSSSFELPLEHPVFAYRATDGARARLEAGAADGDVVVSREYVQLVRDAFAGLGDGELAEFERTTEPLTFPERALELVGPGPVAGDASGP
jgi:hypothetical protein